jgi:hypothetical protein
MRLRKPASRLRLMLVALLLALTVLSVRPVYGQPSSPSSGSVVLTEAEADSVLTEIKLLHVDIWELERQAEADSLYYEKRLELQARAYEDIIEAYQEDRPGWLERFVKQPVVWLAVGVWLGVQAQ